MVSKRWRLSEVPIPTALLSEFLLKSRQIKKRLRRDQLRLNLLLVMFAIGLHDRFTHLLVLNIRFNRVEVDDSRFHRGYAFRLQLFKIGIEVIG
ncbi:Uncharacterised protein [Vibrio cholerae]|uniref:Uncharacterized protein n=1 Tax=Vibrio cholerae TaxID=666 RepID=A0A655UEJ8_VIBCL|nr:Uncharacterised protein [Vibrio cholerae]CSB55155.1 Uncharacterised protein [Vibrio cholerae]CSB65485.1 Uncharacterised protein [Vibrio cholerae]CSC85425.1 Uncharacterised protein [Vibrio cholerae]